MSKIQDFMGKINLLFWSLSISPWASFATWLHLEAPLENTEKIKKGTSFQTLNEFLLIWYCHWACLVLPLGVLGIAGKLLMPSLTSLKRNSKKFKIYSLEAAQNPINHNMVDWNFRGN